MKYLVSGREMKNWERQAMENYKIPSILLMERAALAVVEELTSGSYDLGKVLVACGTGNNGGDGLAVARLLMAKDIKVEVCIVGAWERLSPEAKQQLEMYQAISGKFVTVPAYDEYTVMVDAIFGIGCNREIKGIAAKVIDAINAENIPVVAIDVPSGISSDTGKVCGVAVKADVTITFFTEKLGILLYPGRDYCGQIKVADLGIPFENAGECQVITYDKEDLNRLPKRVGNAHKGTCGKVLVIAGSPTISGAAYLSAAGAYRMGAGLVKIYTSKENKAAMQTLLPEALLESYDRDRISLEQLKQCMEWADVIVIGPGLGKDLEAEKILKYVVDESNLPMVIDADGLNILAEHPEWLLAVHAPVILTPHIQEMARLTKISREQIQKKPMETAKCFVSEYPVILILKDARTIVAKENELIYVNTSGNSGMATGGSGDVLSGILGGLMAQGMDELEAARLGVYLHGRAGDAAAETKSIYSMTATDILNGITEVTRV